MPLILIALIAALGFFYTDGFRPSLLAPASPPVVLPKSPLGPNDWTASCKQRLEEQRDAEVGNPAVGLARGKVEIVNAGDAGHPIPFVEYTLLTEDGRQLYQVSVTPDTTGHHGHYGSGSLHCPHPRWFHMPDREQGAKVQRELYGKSNGRLARIYTESDDVSASVFVADFKRAVERCFAE